MNDPNRRVLRISAGPTALPDVLRYIIGTALLALGAFAAIGSLMRMRGVDVPPQLVVPLGLAFAGAGTWLLFWRRGATLDRRDNTVKTWWGLLVPFHCTGTYGKDEFTVVSIRAEYRSNSRSQSGHSPQRIVYLVYPVCLEREQGGPVVMAESRRYLGSRRQAEAAADFLGLGVLDYSGGTAAMREAGTLDMPLAERLRYDGEKVEVPPRPDHTGIKHRTPGSTAVFSIPAPGFKLIEYLSLGGGGLMLLLGIFVTVRTVVGNKSRDPIDYAAGPLALLPGLVVVGKALRDATTAEEVTVSREGISVKRRGPLSFGTGKIPAQELEDLVIGHAGGKFFGGPVLLARSDRAVLTFGKGLERPELDWLQAMIRRSLLFGE